MTTPLEIARRHVREGRQRIWRQEQLIAELERDGHHGLLPEAEYRLEELQSFQRELEVHLAELERQRD